MSKILLILISTFFISQNVFSFENNVCFIECDNIFGPFGHERAECRINLNNVTTNEKVKYGGYALELVSPRFLRLYKMTMIDSDGERSTIEEILVNATRQEQYDGIINKTKKLLIDAKDFGYCSEIKQVIEYFSTATFSPRKNTSYDYFIKQLDVNSLE